MRKAPLKSKKGAVQSGKKIISHKRIVVSIKNVVRITQLGDGFARFALAPVTIPAFSSRNITASMNGYNMISGSWFLTGTQQGTQRGYVHNNYSSGESTWFFTAWNPSNVAISAFFVVIGKRKP
ncbi:hypothetical protein NQ117_02680 [Paenibacillus sp. SC116]|uniref:hypothetical protein n=1 Tax=Paenibacillus sp. SC116 TaxID=2968986 RepID=UPI00215B486D|nr:hypothetical protein [Paenibacillus sp. SC116]MCR8842576.1 hypothetical protein [Paenibacillus sp. SC116]